MLLGCRHIYSDQQKMMVRIRDSMFSQNQSPSHIFAKYFRKANTWGGRAGGCVTGSCHGDDDEMCT